MLWLRIEHEIKSFSNTVFMLAGLSEGFEVGRTLYIVYIVWLIKFCVWSTLDNLLDWKSKINVVRH